MRNQRTLTCSKTQGPAYNTKALTKGDVLIAVDGKAVDLDSLHEALIGTDVPVDIFCQERNLASC
jgi:C-terminal processing protease CtpA/Prc